MNCNTIKQVAIRELLDGRTFFIPSYQRGYRWTKTQIYDLCNDLLEYALKRGKDPQAFYSLQTLIVREIKEKVYEVIDGQQRLTSIYILYRFLLNYKYIKSDEDLNRKKNLTLYRIYYETRPNDSDIIKKIGYEPINQCDVKDIDVAHIVNAYNYINQWLYSDPEGSQATFSLFSNEAWEADTIVDKLFKLLNNKQKTEEPEGNVQFIWYEIDASKDAIQEFLSENKGKIKLTDTEKIRALFMQRKGSNETKGQIQLSIAKDWELIENTLHRNDFWSFVSNATDKEDGRIDLIFKYIYDRYCLDKSYKGEDYLFRYYYRLFNNKSSNDKTIIEEWTKVIETFQMLQNWYRNPRLYNLIGLLTKEGLSTKAISDIYDNPNVVTTEDFITRLKQRVCKEIVDAVPIAKDNQDLDVKGEYVNLFFDKPKDKEKIPGLLRFINVNVLCNEIEELLKDTDKSDDEKKASDMGRSNRDELSVIYRFPFDALDAFKWDVEHIDSATTNTLTNPEEQLTWIKESEEALGTSFTEDQTYSQKKSELESATDDESKKVITSEMLKMIRNLIGEDDIDERKNWIGNLTLLDCGTNRMYKNKIFALKRQIIHGRINRGVYVPICTQNVFNKIYKGCSKGNLRWDINDKKAYHQFILDTINDFKKNYSKP